MLIDTTLIDTINTDEKIYIYPKVKKKIIFVDNAKKHIRKCTSTRNSKTMLRCEAKVSNGVDLCGKHKRSRVLILPNGSVWSNEQCSNQLSMCVQTRKPILFWEIFSGGFPEKKFHSLYSPQDVKYLRDFRKKGNFQKYLKNELHRMGFFHICVLPERYFWFVNLVYFLGNFPMVLKRIQRFYHKIVMPKIRKKRQAVKKIIKCYRNYKIKKKLPKLISHGKIWKTLSCSNIHDPITQESFVDVPPERWVICHHNPTNNCWWFDVASVVQLLGSPGSHSGENPFNREIFPPEFIMETDETFLRLKDKYQDLHLLTKLPQELETLNDGKTELPSPCYNYKRFLTKSESCKLFESFNEHGFRFPYTIFLKFSLFELRALAMRMAENWLMYSEEERKKIFPDGVLFSPSFILNIPIYGNFTELQLIILSALIKIAVLPEKKEDRTTGCINSMILLGSINKEAHDIVKEYGLCECSLFY
jgi:hypothetical protein